jgi:RNA polymerase-binding transcription factor DksA
MTGKKPTAKELDDYRLRLKTMIAVLTGDIGNLEEEALGSSASSRENLKDGGSDGYYQEFSLQLLERDESTMREVLDALDRVESGDYGRCEMCTGWIPRERLRMVPHARFCIECKRKEEEEVA